MAWVLEEELHLCMRESICSCVGESEEEQRNEMKKNIEITENNSDDVGDSWWKDIASIGDKEMMDQRYRF